MQNILRSFDPAWASPNNVPRRMAAHQGLVKRPDACGIGIMKGRTMDIKFAHQSRVARYGIALGVLLYAVWRGLVWFFVPKNFDPRHLRNR
jgi:hypothetical protein